MARMLATRRPRPLLTASGSLADPMRNTVTFCRSLKCRSSSPVFLPFIRPERRNQAQVSAELVSDPQELATDMTDPRATQSWN